MHSYILEAKLLEAYWLLERHLKELDTAIDSLPRGAVILKEINGRHYYYHQWTEDGQTRNEYLKNPDLPFQIGQKVKLRQEYLKYRKQLIADLKSIEKMLGGEVSSRADSFHRRREIKETKEGAYFCEWKLSLLPGILTFEDNWSLEDLLF